jgi:hypothetical protein
LRVLILALLRPRVTFIIASRCLWCSACWLYALA